MQCSMDSATSTSSSHWALPVGLPLYVHDWAPATVVCAETRRRGRQGRMWVLLSGGRPPSGLGRGRKVLGRARPHARLEAQDRESGVADAPQLIRARGVVAAPNLALHRQLWQAARHGAEAGR
jgi:hypothetical protein